MFNPEKLDWFNQQHLLRLAPDELARRLKPWFEAAGLWDEAYLGERHAWFFAVLELLKPRAKRLDEFVELGRFFFVDAVEYDAAAVAKHLRADGMDGHLAGARRGIRGAADVRCRATEAALRAVAEARGVKAAALIHARRVALTGRTVSPGLFEVLALLGRDRASRRGLPRLAVYRRPRVPERPYSFPTLNSLSHVAVRRVDGKVFPLPSRRRGLRRKTFPNCFYC